MKTSSLFLKTFLLCSLLFVSCQEEIGVDNDLANIEKQDDNNSNTSLRENSTASIKKLILNSDIQISYPIQVVTYYKDAQQSGSETFENKRDLFTFLKGLTNNILATIKYPITIYDSNQNEIVIRNNQGLNTEAEKIVTPKPEDYLNNDLIESLLNFIPNHTSVAYPIGFKIGIKNSNLDALEINTDKAENTDDFINLLSSIQNSQNQKFMAIQYPIYIGNSEINNNTALKSLINTSLNNVNNGNSNISFNKVIIT